MLGVPTSAGSHNRGQEKAPDALRRAGLVERLTAAGADVQDAGDLASYEHHGAPRVDGVRDLQRVTHVAGAVAEAVADVRRRGRLPVVLGGDCTITLGVVSGLARSCDVGLMYVDGDADLNTPDSSDSGVLDTMGMTHLLGGGTDELSRLGPRYPLVSPQQVVLFGFDPAELDTGQWTRLVSQHLYAAPAPTVRSDPARAADEARSFLENSCDAFLLHLDVDVLDSGSFPLANFPHFGGLALPDVMTCLARFTASPRLAGIVVTEVNPDHDPEGRLLRELVDSLVGCLARST